MGRKADPRGKDRPRTIVLRGDVADIAQKLADQGILSKTLSDLLSEAYGFGDKLDEHKRALVKLIDERKAMQQAEEELIAEIDRLEQKSIEDNATLRPSLEKRRNLLLERLVRLEKERNRAFTPIEERTIDNKILNVNQLIVEVDLELEALN